MPLTYDRRYFVDRDDPLEVIGKKIQALQKREGLEKNYRVNVFFQNHGIPVHGMDSRGIGNTWVCSRIVETYLGVKNVFVFYHAFQFVMPGFEEAEVTKILERVYSEMVTAGETPLPYFDTASLTDWVGGVLEKHAGKRKAFVFLFDNLHLASKDLRIELEKRLLRTVVESPHALILLFSDLPVLPESLWPRMEGVPQSPWNIRRFSSDMACIRLPFFSEEHTRAQLQLLECADLTKQKKIFEYSEGHPGINAVLAELPLAEIDRLLLEAPKKKAETMLQAIDERYRRAVPVLSVIGHAFSFTEEEIGNLLNDFSFDPDDIWDQAHLDEMRYELQQIDVYGRPVVLQEDAAFKIGDSIQRVLNEHICQTDPERWKGIHAHMAQVCLDSVGVAKLEEKARWQERADLHLQYSQKR